MAKFYPRKQTVLIALVCVLAVGGTYAYIGHSSNAEMANAPVSVAPADTAQSISSSDDWKKDFYAQALAATNSFDTTKAAKPAARKPEPQTLTDVMSQDLFSRFMELNKANQLNNPDMVQGALDETMQTLSDNAPRPKAYVLADVHIGSDSEAATRAYKLNLLQVFADNAPTDDPVVETSKALDANDMSLLSSIDPIISKYKKLEAALRRMNVPQSLAEKHLELMNDASSMVFISQSLRDLGHDAAQSIVALSIYKDVQASVAKTLGDLTTYLDGFN